MNSLEVNIRDNSTKGQLNTIRNSGNVPAIIYGGKEQNQKISIPKKSLKSLIEKENFLSTIISLNIDGKPQNVLPKEIKYHILSDEPIHVDFLRVLPGVKVKIEIPVNFINHDKSPGLKKNGVLVSKVFMGEDFEEIKIIAKKNFKKINFYKPKSSRDESRETYIHCSGLST